MISRALRWRSMFLEMLGFGEEQLTELERRQRLIEELYVRIRDLESERDQLRRDVHELEDMQARVWLIGDEMKAEGDELCAPYWLKKYSDVLLAPEPSDEDA